VPWRSGPGDGQLAHRFLGHEAKIVVSPYRLTSGGPRRQLGPHGAPVDLAGRKPGPVLSGHQGPVNAGILADAPASYSASTDGTSASGGRRWRLQSRSIAMAGINVLARLPGGDVSCSAGSRLGCIVDGERRNRHGASRHERPVLALACLEKPGVIATGGGDGVSGCFGRRTALPSRNTATPMGRCGPLAFPPTAQPLLRGFDDLPRYGTSPPREPSRPSQPLPPRFQVPTGLGQSRGGAAVRPANAASATPCSLRPQPRRPTRTSLRSPGSPTAWLSLFRGAEALEFVWTPSAGQLFELGPEVFTPGSKMPLQKMPDTRATRRAHRLSEARNRGPTH